MKNATKRWQMKAVKNGGNGELLRKGGEGRGGGMCLFKRGASQTLHALLKI